MNLDEYQRLALRTARDLPAEERLLNAALGLSGEAGEFADSVKKLRFHGHTLDQEELLKELGDLLWYTALAANALGVPLSDVAKRNIAKLSNRYPNGFSEQASRDRIDL
ncbi:MAG: nucleoside triphosphate pyrophosphohydrolase family protein [Roseiflexaceae bacterium]|nr:nucleoside triphosphate pyrophosphohydrolase family protein [Roseiflexaceae bacterium]